eukprot:g1847.t1
MHHLAKIPILVTLFKTDPAKPFNWSAFRGITVQKLTQHAPHVQLGGFKTHLAQHHANRVTQVSSSGARECSVPTVNDALPVPTVSNIDAVLVATEANDEVTFQWTAEEDAEGTFHVEWSEALNFNNLVGSATVSALVGNITVPWPATEKVLYFRVRLVTGMTVSGFGAWSEPTSEELSREMPHMLMCNAVKVTLVRCALFASPIMPVT